MNEKSKIAKDWLQAFPGLGKFSKNKFFKIIGPLLVGLELIDIRGFGYYRPHFSMYSLWNDSIEACLKSPMILFAFRDDRNLQFSIPYEDHEQYFEAAVNAVKSKTMLPLYGNCSFNNIVGVIDEYLNSSDGKARGDGNKANLLAAKLMIASYLDSNEIKSILLKSLDIESKSWNPIHIRPWFGKIDTWITNLKREVEEVEIIKAQVAKNVSDDKLKKLPSSVIFFD